MVNITVTMNFEFEFVKKTCIQIAACAAADSIVFAGDNPMGYGDGILFL